MAKLSTIMLNTDRIKGGTWMTVHTPDGESFEIHTRGFTPAFRDELAKLKAEAARELNRGIDPGQRYITPDTLPPSADDLCHAKAIIAHCLLGIRGLSHEDGRTVTLDEFTALMMNPIEGEFAMRLALEAVRSVAQARDQETKEAVGN